MVLLSQIPQHHITAEWLEGTGSCWCSEGDNCLCHKSKRSWKFYFQGRQYLHFWIGLKKLQLYTTIKLMIASRERDGFHFTYYTLKTLPQLQSLSCCNRSVNLQIFHRQLQGGKKRILQEFTDSQCVCLTKGDLVSGRKTWGMLLTDLLP